MPKSSGRNPHEPAQAGSRGGAPPLQSPMQNCLPGIEGLDFQAKKSQIQPLEFLSIHFLSHRRRVIVKNGTSWHRKYSFTAHCHDPLQGDDGEPGIELVVRIYVMRVHLFYDAASLMDAFIVVVDCVTGAAMRGNGGGSII